MAVFNNILAGASGQTGGAAAGYEITRSLRFNSADSAYLNRTPSSAGNRKTFTLSCWVKKATLGANQGIFNAGTSSGSGGIVQLYFTSSEQIAIFARDSGGTAAYSYTTSLYRDASAWYHIVLSIDTAQASFADQQKLWVNGVQVTAWDQSQALTQNTDLLVNSTVAHYIGPLTSLGGSLSNYLSSYLCDYYLIDGQALSSTDFGEFDANNVWQPIAYAGTYGTNGFHLDFSDATSTTTIAEDSSGNNNDWTANNISVTAGADNDSLFDSPTIANADSDTGAGGEVSGNYAILSPIWASPSAAISDGGLQLLSVGGNYDLAISTIPLLEKTYWETVVPAALTFFIPGIIRIDSNPITSGSDRIGLTATTYPNSAAIWPDAQAVYYNGTSTYNTGNIWSPGDIIGHAFDPDTGNYYGWRNGSALNSGSAVATLSTSYTYAVALMTASTTNKAVINFGQRAFAYTAPTGYQPLTTALLDDPTIADGSTAMDVVTYSSTNAIQAITLPGSGFQPDFVWTKSRSNAYQHDLYDAVRGAGSYLVSNSTAAAGYDANTLKSFDSAGFTLGNSDDSNFGSGTSVAWCWDGGSSTVSNTDGSITSSVRANASAGFSIVSYTGTNSDATVGHGLGVTPSLIIVKCRTTATYSTTDWYVFTQPTGKDAFLVLNKTLNTQSNSGFWGTPNSSTFGVKNASGNNISSSDDHIAYCFAPVSQYSAFGSYTGNGSSDGPFVYTGFRPRWIMIKCSSSDQGGNAHWAMYDTARLTRNPGNSILFANLTSNQLSTYSIDILSNGFKVRDTDAEININNDTYVWAAFAENPFKNARAR